MGIFDAIGSAISSGINDFEHEVSNVAGEVAHAADHVAHQAVSEVNGATQAVGNFMGAIPGEINSIIQDGEGAIGGLPGVISGLVGDIFSNRTEHAAHAASTPGYTPASGTGKAADPNDGFVPPSMDENTALFMLQQNFDRFDTAAGGAKDGLVSRADLKAILADPETTAQMKAAAQYLLQSPTGFNQAETAQFGGKCDGLIGKGDVDTLLSKFEWTGGIVGFANHMAGLYSNAQKAAAEWTAHTASASSSGNAGPVHTALPPQIAPPVHTALPVHTAVPATVPAKVPAASTTLTDGGAAATAAANADPGVVTARGDGTVDGTLDSMAQDAAAQLDDLFAKLNGKNLSDRDFQTIQLKINHLSQIMTMVSNMEKELHDLRMSVINNIR